MYNRFTLLFEASRALILAPHAFNSIISVSSIASFLVTQFDEIETTKNGINVMEIKNNFLK